MLQLSREQQLAIAFFVVEGKRTFAELDRKTGGPWLELGRISKINLQGQDIHIPASVAPAALS